MIPNKEITQNQFHNLVTYQKLTSGGEATICETDNPYSLYKIFSFVDKPKPMNENKVKKISQLYEMKVEHSIQPLSTISLNDIIIGYEMTTDFGLEKSQLQFLPPEEQKYFLTKTKEILEYFSSLGIIYGDIEPRNILFNRETGEIRFCDMDNISLNGLPMDLTPSNVDVYTTYRPIDQGLHPYMHNIMTLKTLGLDSYWATKRELKQYFKRPAIKTVTSMKNPADFNNEYIIQYIKKLKKDNPY